MCHWQGMLHASMAPELSPSEEAAVVCLVHQTASEPVCSPCKYCAERTEQQPTPEVRHDVLGLNVREPQVIPQLLHQRLTRAITPPALLGRFIAELEPLAVRDYIPPCMLPCMGCAANRAAQAGKIAPSQVLSSLVDRGVNSRNQGHVECC